MRLYSLQITAIAGLIQSALSLQPAQDEVAFLDPNYQFEQADEKNARLVRERAPIFGASPVMESTLGPTPTDGLSVQFIYVTTTLTEFVTVSQHAEPSAVPRPTAHEPTIVSNAYAPVESVDFTKGSTVDGIRLSAIDSHLVLGPAKKLLNSSKLGAGSKNHYEALESSHHNESATNKYPKNYTNHTGRFHQFPLPEDKPGPSKPVSSLPEVTNGAGIESQLHWTVVVGLAIIFTFLI